ncbi:hypothetical protein JCM11251_007578 [Rhodosporidiobolus azoricus]
MADTQRAAHLVSEDTLGSRGFAYSDLQTAEEERELHDPTRSSYELTPRPPTHKGKERAYHDEDDTDADHAATSAAWARRSEEEGAGLRRGSLARLEAGRRSTRAGGFDAASDEAEKERLRVLWWRSASINVLFILAWYCFSTLISVYNKWMFSEDHYNFPYPLFVTSVHMLVQFCLSALTLSIFTHLRPTSRPAAGDYGTKVAPCGMATGLDIGLSNLSLRTITLSFYTMCKSSSLAFVLLFAFLFRLEIPSWRLVGIILIITAGVILMVSTETQFHFVGMVEVLTASALGGLRWSLTQLLLDKDSMGMGNPIATLFWLAPVMGTTLATCSIIFDGWGNVFGQEEFFGSFSATIRTIGAIIFPGFLAFAMNVTEFGLIQRTSVVTLSVAGIFKEVAVIFLSTVLFGDELTPINVSGLCVTIFGIALYNYLKYRQFTSGEGGGGHGHAGNGSRTSEQQRFEDTTAEESYEEGAPMLLRKTAENGKLYDPTAPNHSLGESDSPTSSRRSSFERLDAQAAELLGDFDDPHSPSSYHLHRETADAKLHQHDADRIDRLGELVRQDEELVETERRLDQLEEELEGGLQREEVLFQRVLIVLRNSVALRAMAPYAPYQNPSSAFDREDLREGDVAAA